MGSHGDLVADGDANRDGEVEHDAAAPSGGKYGTSSSWRWRFPTMAVERFDTNTNSAMRGLRSDSSGYQTTDAGGQPPRGRARPTCQRAALGGR